MFSSKLALLLALAVLSCTLIGASMFAWMQWSKVSSKNCLLPFALKRLHPGAQAALQTPVLVEHVDAIEIDPDSFHFGGPGYKCYNPCVGVTFQTLKQIKKILIIHATP